MQINTTKIPQKSKNGKQNSRTHINNGFEFLGWNFRKYNGKLRAKPSKKSVEKVTKKISDIIKEGKAWKQKDLIVTLNPIITGWVNYHQTVASSEIFRKINYRIWNMLWHWAKRRHPEKSKQWIARKYWRTVGNRNWVFTDGDKVLNPLYVGDMNPYLNKKYFVLRKLKQKRYTILRRRP